MELKRGQRIWLSLSLVNGVVEGTVNEVKDSSVMVDDCWYSASQCHETYAEAKAVHDVWLARYRNNQEKIKQRKLSHNGRRRR